MSKIYHNPRCRKSREALGLLEEKGIQPEVVEYLKTPLSQNELKDLLKKLHIKAEDLVRKGEPVYKEIYKGKNLTEAEWVKVLAENPILIERPIFVNGTKAVVGRPPEEVLSIV